MAYHCLKAAYSVGAPQIRNVGTVIGNLVTASPANDTITPLIALDAELTIRSKKGERTIKLCDFYKGVRKTDLASNEIVVDVHFNKLAPNKKGKFLQVFAQAGARNLGSEHSRRF